MKILVTGGAGYIGSHTCLESLNAGHEVIVLDNLANSKIESLKRVEDITGKKIKFYKADLVNIEDVKKVFVENTIDAVIHFAGLKAVGQSVKMPMYYYHNNITGSINLFKVMDEANVKNLVFSSSATVYGDPATVPITEDFPTSVTNPYGRTKLMIEEMLTDISAAYPEKNIILLRYFNPVGAHSSGKIGEDPNGIPNNLVPYISQVAVGKLEELSVFGDDYNTKDGTGVRDYIHVVDLALGHLKALDKLSENPGLKIYNLGTGKGYSVLEIIEAFKKASGREIKYKVVDRRPGDIAACYADCTRAGKELGWKADKEIKEMCADSWNWQEKNPKGYE